MTEETPTKVMGFLGAALMSMAFLFVVTATDASFAGTKSAMPDPFAPQHVVAVIDSAANGYSGFLTAYLFQPAQSDYAYFTGSVKDDSSWVLDNTDTQIVAMAGLSDLLWQEPTPMAHPSPHSGHVAGAYTMRASP
jgi:hypothetical protein